VATVLRNHPELKSRIVEVIAVAGRREGQSFRTSPEVRPFRDFNFELDPKAFQILLDSRVRLVLAPWEISSKVWLTEDDLAALHGMDWLVEPARDWLAYWRRDLKAPGFNTFDTLAVGYAISPKAFKCDATSASIRTLPDDAQGAGDKPYLLRDQRGGSKPVLYCYDAGPGFKADLMKRLQK